MIPKKLAPGLDPGVKTGFRIGSCSSEMLGIHGDATQAGTVMLDQIKPHALAWEEQGFTPREVLRKMGELGFLGIRYPAEYGGAEMNTLGSVVLAEELGRSTFSGVAITVLV